MRMSALLAFPLIFIQKHSAVMDYALISKGKHAICHSLINGKTAYSMLLLQLFLPLLGSCMLFNDITNKMSTPTSIFSTVMSTNQPGQAK